MKRCPICSADYPAPYKYCPEDASPLAPTGDFAEHPCPSCRAITEKLQDFCTTCGTDLRSRRKLSSDADAGSPDRAEATTQSTQKPRSIPPARMVSAFRKQLSNDLAQAFSAVEPRERPWFGMEVDGCLLAVSPRGIVVAEMIDPGAIETAVVHVSLDPLEPWLLTTPDRSGHPIPNPVPRVLQAIRGFKTKLARYLDLQAKTTPVRFKGLVVFPDEYDVTLVKGQVNYDTASTAMRVINARELAGEILKPVQKERLSVERCKKWLQEAKPVETENNFLAETWLDPDGRAKPARTPPKQTPSLQRERKASEVSQPSNAAPPPQSRPKTGRSALTLAGVSFVVLVLTSIGLWHVLDVDRHKALNPVLRPLAREALPPAGLPQVPDATPLSEPTAGEAPPQTENPITSNASPAGAGGNSGREAETETARIERDRAGNRAEEKVQISAEAQEERRRVVEHRIDRAIRNRAVRGVAVSFVDDTAYLAGEVISDNQKAAAERAARGIPGVKRVRSSISVVWKN